MCFGVFFAQTIREILLLGHRQAFAWIDDWISMTIADVRSYECEMQRRTNTKVNACAPDEANADQQQTDGVGPRSPNRLLPLTNIFSPSSSPQPDKSNSTSWFSWWSLNGRRDRIIWLPIVWWNTIILFYLFILFYFVLRLLHFHMCFDDVRILFSGFSLSLSQSLVFSAYLYARIYQTSSVSDDGRIKYCNR